MSVGAWSLTEARADVLSKQDWAPTQSTAFIAELDRFLWTAIRKCLTLVPYLFAERATLYVQPYAQNSPGATDRLRVHSTDSLVLERATTDSSRTPFDFTGLWGNFNLWVRTTTGITHRFRIQELWTDQESGYERISLDKPFPGGAPNASMTWKIFQDIYPLPADTVTVLGVRCWEPTNEGYRLMRGVTERQIDEQQLAGSSTYGALLSGDMPALWSRGPQVHRQPPRSAPSVTNAGTWEANGDDTGEWEYCRTLCWGILDPDALDPHGNQDPTWESPPSPVSAKITSTAGAGGAITITWPAPDYMAHFSGPTATGRVSTFRSGYYSILYARRVSDTEATPLDEMAGFYRLAVVDATPGSYVHDGTAQLVYERPLRAQNTIPSIRFWPITSLRREMDLRIVRAPLPMVVGADVLPVPHEAQEIVTLYARKLLAEKCNQFAVAKDLDVNQIPAAVKAVTGVYQADSSRSLVRGDCNARLDIRNPYSLSQLEYLFLGRST